MFKILLVDDEKLVIDSLVNFIDWESVNMSIVGTAKNGRDALEKVQELRPDIVLTDVKMPIMDGIEFSRKAKEYDRNLKVIFLSGYDEFKYAKAAIEIGACDYILKPIEYDEFYDTIGKVKLKCEIDKYSSITIENLRQNYFKQLLTEKSGDNARELTSKIVKLNERDSYLLKSSVYLAIICIDNYPQVIKNMDSNAIEKVNKSVYDSIINTLEACNEASSVIKLENGRYCIILSEKNFLSSDIEDKWKFIKEDIEDSSSISLSLGICDKKGKLDKIQELYSLSSKAVNDKFYYGKSQIVISSEIKEPLPISLAEIKNIENQIIDSVCKDNKKEVYINVDKYFQLLCDKKVKRDIINISIYDFVNSIYEYFMKYDNELYARLSEKSNILENISSYDNIVSIKEYLMDMLNSIMNYFREGSESSHIINKIISILKRNYNKVVSADDLSKEIYLTPNYIRTIFKNYTGETILKYHTKLRMEKVIELLGDRSQKIHDISVMVGYENISYFCSLFSKYYGMTPNEYRKKYFDWEEV